MPRKARIDAPGAFQHIIVRGIERRKIFFDATDRDDFLTRLGGVLSDTRTSCFAWALMPNHLHLLLRTGSAPIVTVMRRLLTGYAVSFNHRHRRHGHLFQNRYKSILCEADPYLLELVRYIHLNPLRGGLIQSLSGLDTYPYSGHSTIVGRAERQFQGVGYVLRRFDKTTPKAVERYREFVRKGISAGRRPDLVGGGLIRSTGGWAAVRMLRQQPLRIKSDERILGGGDFVDEVLKAARENLERKYAIRTGKCDFDWLVRQVARSLEMRREQVLAPGRYKAVVTARSLLCYWGMRELGMSTTELAKNLGVSQATVSQSAMRGRRIAAEKGLRLHLLL